jgi:ribosomal-protein-alanine N-acetyltransferase
MNFSGISYKKKNLSSKFPLIPLGMKHALETERLRLIPFELMDLDLLHKTFTNPFVREYLWDNEIISREKTREILLTNEQYFENNSWGLWKVIIKRDQEYAGFAGLWIFFEDSQPQLLYGLLPGQTGMGYATEASNAVIDYAFNDLKFNFVVASFDTPHMASRKVCEKLHMKEVEEKCMDGKWTTFYQIDKEKKHKAT